jgi:hypothetical protein
MSSRRRVSDARRQVASVMWRVANAKEDGLGRTDEGISAWMV